MGNISTHNEEKEGFSKNKNAHRYYSVAPPLQSSSRGLSKRALKSIAATTAIEAATEFAAAEIAKAEIVDVKPLYAAGMDLARKDLAWTHATELVTAAEQEQTESNKRSGQEMARICAECAAEAEQARKVPEAAQCKAAKQSSTVSPICILPWLLLWLLPWLLPLLLLLQ